MDISSENTLECQFCKSAFSKASNLRKHQTTVRSCLAIQESLGRTVQIKEFKCPYENCGKKLVSKTAWDYHVLHCKINLQRKQQIGDVLSEEVQLLKQQLNETNRKLQTLQTIVPAPVQHINTDNSTTTTTNSHTETKSRNLPLRIRQMVWNTYIGKEEVSAKCVCCRDNDILNTQFVCGHVQARAEGGSDQINNLRPICAACNANMGTLNMNDFTTEYFGWKV